MSARSNRPYRYQMYASLPDEKLVYASAASGPPKLVLGLDHPLGALRWRAGRECFRDGERNVTTEELQTNGLMCGESLFTPKASKRQGPASDIVDLDQCPSAFLL